MRREEMTLDSRVRSQLADRLWRLKTSHTHTHTQPEILKPLKVIKLNRALSNVKTTFNVSTRVFDFGPRESTFWDNPT